MALPVGSHRAYYRSRVNQRVTRTVAPGSPRTACSAGSRWHNFAFTRHDLQKQISVHSNRVLVGSSHRTDIDPSYVENGVSGPSTCSNVAPRWMIQRGKTCESKNLEWVCRARASWTKNKYCQKSCYEQGVGYEGDDCSIGWASMEFDGYICGLDPLKEAIGGWVALSTHSDCTSPFNMQNLGIWLMDPSQSTESSLQFSSPFTDVLLLDETPATCNLKGFVRVAGKYYLHDSRLELVENTVEKPAWSSGSETCSSAPKTFLNEKHCRLQPSCTPLSSVDAQFQLNRSTLQQFYTVAGKYVYAVTGLRTDASPCGTLSRWKRLDCSRTSCSMSSLSAEDSLAIATGLEMETGWLRDIDVSCQSVLANSVVQVDNEYFQHVHLHEYNVYDFSSWVGRHPGGSSHITRWASLAFELIFPPGHVMARWMAGSTQNTLQYLGRMQDTITFQGLPTSLQIQAIGASFDSTGTGGHGQTCGSPGEVANDPAAGNQVAFFSVFDSQNEYTDIHFDNPFSYPPHTRFSKSTVWTMKVLTGEDQLRQRMAWALSQIFVVGTDGFGNEEYTELWVNYYDIFVRNAFGNFRDVLREVTYSPLMGSYLTYVKNTAYDTDNNYPDENYAREIMQLFTVGLWKLNADGSRKLDINGEPAPTYSNEHIMNFARVMTGFDEQLPRANVEKMEGSGNKIDPMRMRPKRHDVYPKPDLDGNFLGDGYPLCSDLPTRGFLSQGAKYEFIGYKYDGSDVLVVNQESDLYGALCTGSGACTFSLSVELERTLACHVDECKINMPKVVKVATGYYEYVPPMCVHLFFYSDGRVVAEGGRRFTSQNQRKCLNPRTLGAGTSCCGGCSNSATRSMKRKKNTCEIADAEWLKQRCNLRSSWRQSKYCQLACWQNDVGYTGDNCSAGAFREEQICRFPGERLAFADAEALCASRGLSVCEKRTSAIGCGYESMHVWTPSPCSHTIEVHAEGKVSAQTDNDAKQNSFTVQWHNDNVPNINACPSGCNATSDGCLCAMQVESRPVFTHVPRKAELHLRLKIGALPPTMPCSICSGEVKAYTVGVLIDESAVFEYGGRFFKNSESIVHVGDSHSFRNPPTFMIKGFPSGRAALAEVENLLDHLVHHENTPVFIGYRLIQRFVTSNPSPSYLQDVGEAFRTGRFGGTVYSGSYGDLAATVAAVLLHPEARSLTDTLENHGALREPISKIIHFLRAMDYEEGDQREIVLKNLEDVIGQAPYESPTVFNFYYPDYQPARFHGALVAPEFQIFNAPLVVGFINGMMSLIDYGVSSCNQGFGQTAKGCARGSFGFGESATANETFAELDLLLTGGRLNSNSVVREAFETATEEDRLKAAQRAIVMTPEFHAMGDPLVVGTRPAKVVEELASPTSYKATVLLFLRGGADTFNMLVPYQCSLFDEYKTVRGDIALEPWQLHEITTTGQACAQFGIHHKLPFLKELYDRRKAAFVSNVGSLVKPTTRQQFKKGGASTCVGLFSHSDQTQAAQTLQCQVAGAAPKGAGGRIADALASKKYRTTSFSVAGTSVWSQGFDTHIDVIDKTKGAVRLENYQHLQTMIGNITSIQHRNVYCEEYARQFAEAIDSGVSLGAYLDNAKLQTQYQLGTSLAKQFHQVAKLIATREERKAERDFFFVAIGGFDTHSNVNEVLEENFKEVDDSLRDFVAELEAQEVFDSIVLTTASDFGRSLTSNGAGTDHAWAGNHFVLGGSINGGRVFNDFPESLLRGNEQDAGRGRLIPKYPWESMMVPIAEWMGIDDSQNPMVFPNLDNFNMSTYIISKAVLFTS